MFEKPVHKNGGLFDPVGFWDRPYILEASPSTPNGATKKFELSANLSKNATKWPKNDPKWPKNDPRLFRNFF